MRTQVTSETDATKIPGPAMADRLRSIAVGASTAAFVCIPVLGPLLAGTEEGAEEYDTEITPPDYAFAIWAPIFVSSVASAIQQIARPGGDVARRSGWWLAGAYGANAVWSFSAQSGRFRYTPLILPIAATLAGIGHQRLQFDDDQGVRSLTPHSVGLLFGWTSVASVVNAFATRRHGRLAATSQPGREAARLGLLGASLVLAAIIATRRRGYVAIALASFWALATSAANSRRTLRTRTFSTVAAAVIAGATGAKLRRDRGMRDGVRGERGDTTPP